MPNRGALVDDRQALCFGLLDEARRVVSGRLEDLHFAIENGVQIGFVWWWIRRRKNSEIHSERPIRHLTTSLDLFFERFRIGLGKPGQYSQPTRVGHG